MRKKLIIIFSIAFLITGCGNTQPATKAEGSIPVETSNNPLPDNNLPGSLSAPEPDKVITGDKGENLSPTPAVKDETSKISVEKLTSKRKTSFNHFNTMCTLLVYDDFTSAASRERFETTWSEIDAMLTNVENAVSVDIAGSDIYRFNEARSGESVEISPLTAEIMDEAIGMYSFTDGAFNPAVANLVDLWGFSPRFLNREDKKTPYDRPQNEDGSFNLPDKGYIEAFRTLSNFNGIKMTRLEKGTYLLTKTSKDIEVNGAAYTLKLDFGGIAKGYAADKAAEIMKNNGYEYGYISIGLSSMKFLKRDVSDKGAPEENMWSINISNPEKPSERYLTGFGKDTGISTSGTYDLHYFLNGREYSHIIDPSTGEPTTSNIVAVTLWGGKAGPDDALSKALIIMGKEKATSFMNTYLKDYHVSMIVRNKGQLELVTNIPRSEYILNDNSETP